MAYYAPFYQPNYYGGRQDAMNQYAPQYQQMQPQMQPPMNQPMPTQPTQAQQTGNGLIWVQGEAGAKSYLVAPGNTVMLMDSEGSRFYLKSADASGMPMPLRIFDFKERTDAPGNAPQAPVGAETIDINKLVTRDEFERRMASMAQQLGIAQNTEVQNNG